MTNLDLVKSLTNNVCESNGVNPNNLDSCLSLAKRLNGINDSSDFCHVVLVIKYDDFMLNRNDYNINLSCKHDNEQVVIKSNISDQKTPDFSLKEEYLLSFSDHTSVLKVPRNSTLFIGDKSRDVINLNASYVNEDASGLYSSYGFQINEDVKIYIRIEEPISSDFASINLNAFAYNPFTEYVDQVAEILNRIGYDESHDRIKLCEEMPELFKEHSYIDFCKIMYARYDLDFDYQYGGSACEGLIPLTKEYIKMKYLLSK